MSTTRIKCRCYLGYKCPAPLHGEIEIITCEKNCGLGCDNGSGKSRKNYLIITSPIACEYYAKNKKISLPKL